MKIFISADMEGITTTTVWEETTLSHASYPAHAKQMTEEVLACIEGAKKAGAKEIVVRDAHDSGRNIDPARMSSGVTLLRNWTGHPYSMAEGINHTFDAALFIGYHSGASKSGNPMSHTMSDRLVYIKLNGIIASEFLLYSFACALEGVPTVFLSGDRMLCEDSMGLHPNLIVCPVKDGIGSMTINYSTEDTLVSIREQSERALQQNLSKAVVALPAFFELEVCYKEHTYAEQVSCFPGVTKKSGNILTFQSDDYFEVLRAIRWIV